MKYIEGFRNPGAAAALREDIRALTEALPPSLLRQGYGGQANRTTNIMEVCGSHTMAIARYGIRDILPSQIKLISGPGCPVCVTDAGYIDTAIELARRGVTIVTFGDMLNVPGSDTSLAAVRSEGHSIEICYSPLRALELAREFPEREIVFLAIGFETTVAPALAVIDQAIAAGVENLSLLVAFKLVPPALAALMTDPDLQIDAFLCPAHVSAIIGADAYQPFTGSEGVPCVIAGFEPLDILLGLKGILTQLGSGIAEVDNQYSRVVTDAGNRRAQALMETYLEPADVSWRGIGVIPASGLALKAEWSRYDAEQRHNVRVEVGKMDPACRCGDVIKGIASPFDCPMFGNVCTPSSPFGPCMVSSEGSCAAYYKYSR
ncbi:MAG: hydrogenase formation protein HypD [Lentisphaerae bacterium]|nr:hydrogenase formation protein HypD [Lentisphaerota bacterium]